ncbi:MAG TPA: PhoU domain-containing protein, partial [Anaerolineales bacterium]|nr:PhoU domain-containing protein [Anaerolineales bacterium]
ELPRQIANAHTIFNVAVSAILFPFVKQITHISGWLTPRDRIIKKTKVTTFIDDMQLGVPAVALNEAARELTRVGEISAQMLQDSCQALIRLDKTNIKSVLVQEDQLVDPIYHELVTFINKLINEDLSLSQQKRCFQLKNLLIDIERVADMAEDIAQYAQERLDNQVTFTSPAIADLENLWTHAHRTYSLALHAFSVSDHEEARQVCRLESEFDKLYWHTRQAHIRRIEQGVCQPEADVIFTEILRILERISDHADNLGVSVARN